jgi:hypothetical protein
MQALRYRERLLFGDSLQVFHIEINQELFPIMPPLHVGPAKLATVVFVFVSKVERRRT